MDPVPFEPRSLRSKGGGNTVEVVLRTIIAVNQLSVCGVVSDMCDKLASRISDCSESTGRLVAEGTNQRPWFVPTDLLTTTKSLLTNETVQGDFLREHERKIANLSDDIKSIRLCSNTGFTKTVAERQYFETLDDAELAKLGGSCRKYTSPRDDQSSTVKGWIRGDTKIGPVLEVAVSCQEGRYVIEIRIKSSLDDGSHSWIMIVNGLNKYVTEMSKEVQENRNDEIGDSAGRFAAKARPKQTSMPMPSFPRVTIPFRMRKWIDVEPGEYDQSSCKVSKKMTRLLRHDPSVLREEDRAVEFKIMAPMFASTFASSPHWSSRTWPSN